MSETGRTVAIIQARMGSSRFPGKMMASLENAPVIEWVLRRTMAAQMLDDVVLATSVLDIDDPLAEAADRLGVTVVRGDEADVLGRYARAAEISGAQTVVRICGDRPLVDAEQIDAAVGFFQREKPDLAFNHISEGPHNWPRGFGAEVLSADHVKWMHENAFESDAREHVTIHMWQNRSLYNIVPVPCPAELNPGVADLLFDLDWPEDLEKLKKLCTDRDFSVSAYDILTQWQVERGSE